MTHMTMAVPTRRIIRRAAQIPIVAALVVLFCALATGCAPSQRESTLRAALVTVNASRDAFTVYDATKQAQIVAAAVSAEDGRARLEAYRASRVKLETAIGAAYRAIAIASSLNDDASLEGVRVAVNQLLDAVQALNFGGTP
jgi:hypothetical protein